uniref:Leishmanolysin-like peptidase n=1 Tax=Haemonchus contortus TaxID=6289 RepID=A0A7I4YQG3_HAECO
MLFEVVHVLLALQALLACHYKPPKPEQVLFGKTGYPAKSRSKREPLWDWIRIKVEYDASVNQLNEEKREFLEDLVTAARHYFESTIKVTRLQLLLLFPTCIGKDGKPVYGVRICPGHCQKMCGFAVPPQNASYYVCCPCADTDEKCKSKQGSCGGPLYDADFVLIVSVLERDCASNMLAYAYHCALDPYTNRPIAGNVNFCPAALKSMKPTEFLYGTRTIKHELTHAFVFSKILYRYFPGAGWPLWDGKEHLIPNVAERFTRVDWETSKGPMKHDVYMITTPKVREEARRHFNCSTLEGAEVENQGFPGTIFSHWEKRVFEDEMMSGSYTQVAAMSRVTLALFEDSGWYKVNYDKAEDIMWGRNLGCTFATKSCLTWMKSNPTNPYPFCRIYRDSRCSPTRLQRATCSLVPLGERGGALPPEFDYNTGNIYQDKKGQPILGHGTLDADYCPYYASRNTLLTEGGFDSSCAFPGNMDYNNYSLEIFSPTARCFELHGGIKVENEVSTYTTTKHTVGCYESICKNNLLMIKTQNSKFYPCYHEGQLIHVEKRLHNIGTVRLQIVCPSCSELCGSQFCAPEKSTEKRIGDPTRTVIKPSVQLASVVLLILILCS